MSEASGKKRLKDLRVTDLKAQLEKRGLATSGVKAVLSERLKKHLEDEGFVAEEYDFDAQESGIKGTPSGGDKCDESKMEEDSKDPGESVTNGDEPKEEEDSELKEKSKENGGEDSSVKGETGQEDDSINLMIEDEENLFAEETRPTTPSSSVARPKPDEAPTTQNEAEEKKAPELVIPPEKKEAPETKEPEVSSPKAKAPGDETSELKSEEKTKEVPEESETNAKKSFSKRNLWISGLATACRATDLKNACSQYGKVVGAKIVTNSRRSEETKCYGYVTMGSTEDAAECIKHLHNTELHGKLISVEWAKSSDKDSKSEPIRKDSKERSVDRSSNVSRSSNTSHNESLKKDDSSSSYKKDYSRSSYSSKQDSRSPTRSRSPRHHHHHGNSHPYRKYLAPGDARHKLRDISPEREDRATRPGIFTVSQIRERREREKEAEEVRRLRERERRRKEDEERHRRDMERRRRHEEEKIERERLELRRERERIEREKAELIKLERENQRLERERLLRAKEELERLKWAQQSRLEENRRPFKRQAPSSFNDHTGGRNSESYYEDKRRDTRGGGHSGLSHSTDRHNSSYQGSSSREEPRSRYEASRGGLHNGHRREDNDYRSSRGSHGPSSSHNRSHHYSSGWNSASSNNVSKSSSGGFPLLNSSSSSGSGTNGGNNSGGNDWSSRGNNSSSQPNIPRPPILPGISMGLNSYNGGNNSSMSGGYGGNSGSAANDRYDAYKDHNMQKRY